MPRFFQALVFTAALASPLIVSTTARAGEPTGSATVTLRIYDPYRHDYHVWDRREDRTYRAYLVERHRAYVRYREQRLSERRAYWRWRHEHERF
jgi:hypothetical protein